MAKPKPEAAARVEIDRALEAAGWVVQDMDELNLDAGPGIAVREFPMTQGHGFADYLLYVDGQAVGALEAKKVGHTLTGVEGQASKYSQGLPLHVPARIRPLPIYMVSTGVQTRLTNLLDPRPRSREIFATPRPETIREWLKAETLREWMRGWNAPEPGLLRVSDSAIPARFGVEPPSTLRTRLQAMPPSDEIAGLWPNQIKAIRGLEKSLREDRPRALIQMATGSGKSLTSVVQIYRLIKFAGARRILFLVDRDNLGIQADDEFKAYRTYDDHRKFTELYTPQRLISNTIGASSKVVITTIQRLYSMLKGEPELDPTLEQGSVFDTAAPPNMKPAEVAYNASLPPEYFDFIFVDECHRSIYSLWRQVLEYFDAYLVGLTATPAKHTYAFFNQNLVMEYSQAMAVADGVNVDFDIYRIRTQITEHGATLLAADTPTYERFMYGQGRPHVSFENLANAAIPLSPAAEQARILLAVAEALTVEEHVLEANENSIARCSRLRQSILKWAFEGKLVDQDPNDEPASVLLERIRAERESAGSKKPRTRSSSEPPQSRDALTKSKTRTNRAATPIPDASASRRPTRLRKQKIA